MVQITRYEMVKTNEYLREHPEEMAKELAFMGLVMPREEIREEDGLNRNISHMAPQRAINEILDRRHRPEDNGGHRVRGT